MFEKLKALREKTGLSQEKVARAAGVSNGTYARLEQGKGDPSVTTIQKLARVLGPEVYDLLKVPQPDKTA